jgi:hypothetical protein
MLKTTSPYASKGSNGSLVLNFEEILRYIYLKESDSVKRVN